MTNPQKNKGDGFERLIVKYLQSQGINAQRTRAGWTADRGDISGVRGLVLECKNHKSPDLSGWVKELEHECDNAGAEAGVIIHKRHRYTEARDQYVTLPLHMFVRLLAQLEDVR